jgi:transketolase
VKTVYLRAIPYDFLGRSRKLHPYDEEVIHHLKSIAVDIRKHIIEMLYHAASGHPGGSLSCVEALVSLYFQHMHHDPKNPYDPNRDRFILSKGHAAPALYAVLAEAGYFPIKELENLRKINSMLQGHPVCYSTPGVEASTGSLGHGLSFASGVAIAGKLDKKTYRVYALIGDGESEEGQIWEAAASAAHYKLDNLTALLDRNYLQIDGHTEEVMRLESVRDRWSSFGWNVIEVDGHDFTQILTALHEAVAHKHQPTMIILETVKGKGVSFMENNVDFHGVPPNEMEYSLAMRELDLAKKKLEETS